MHSGVPVKYLIVIHQYYRWRYDECAADNYFRKAFVVLNGISIIIEEGGVAITDQ